MLNGDFHEGHRMPPSLVKLFPPMMVLLSVHTCPNGTPFLTVSYQLPPDASPELTYTDCWPDASTTGVLADASCVWRYAHTIPLQEKTHAEGETRKELLFV